MLYRMISELSNLVCTTFKGSDEHKYVQLFQWKWKSIDKIKVTSYL
jgi:23S rRNA U2552 (ribose-2'-O)-methylase RlmE/FtsJ